MGQTRERFDLFVPIYTAPLAKSKGFTLKSDVPDDLREWVVFGIASTEDKDIQGEVVVQQGIDFRPLLASGFVNWNHSHDPGDQIGIPLLCEVVEGPALYIEAVLLPSVQKAREVRELIRSCEKVADSGGPVRKIGWSIEGDKLLLDGYRIEKCIVDQMALTHEPVNTFTWSDLLAEFKKSMGGSPMVGMPVAAAMSTADTPLLVQNLDSGITDLLWGECQHNHFDPRSKRFYRGVEGALDHMVRCRGYAPEAAANLLKLVYQSIYA